MKFIVAIAILLLVHPLGAAGKPNTIVIMVDDMGYSDIAPYGGEIKTPNLASLATSGLRFTQFHNSARCCPTRATLMTGLHPHEVGIGHMTGEKKSGGSARPPAYAGNLDIMTSAAMKTAEKIAMRMAA